MDLFIDLTGTTTCIYGEELDLSAIGAVVIRRASNVEPDDTGNWWADMAPSCGPRLGPFPRRSDALTAETQWLSTHMGWVHRD